MTECDWNLLVRYSQHADHAAFAALAERHRPLVEGTCRRILGNCSDVDDVLQATMLKLARSARKLTRNSSPQRSLAPWLSRVATNVSLDIARSGAARRHREQEYARRSGAANGPMSTRPMQPVVDELIAELPEELRGPIVLCYQQGQQHSRAAAELGISEGTLRRRIQSAKSMLRSRFAARGIPLSMFLLHILMDNLASGADGIPSPTPATLPAAEPPMPPDGLPPQATGRLASSTTPLKFAPTTSWGVLAGLLVVAIGLVAALPRLVGEDVSAVAVAASATQAAPNGSDSQREAATPAVPDIEPPVISSRWVRSIPEEVDAFEPQTDVSRPLPEVHAARLSPPQPLTVVESSIVAQPAEAVSVTLEPAIPPRDVDRLFGIEWHTTLESACAAAQEEPARPIFCFRALGELSGFM